MWKVASLSQESRTIRMFKYTRMCWIDDSCCADNGITWGGLLNDVALYNEVNDSGTSRVPDCVLMAFCYRQPFFAQNSDFFFANRPHKLAIEFMPGTPISKALIVYASSLVVAGGGAVLAKTPEMKLLLTITIISFIHFYGRAQSCTTDNLTNGLVSLLQTAFLNAGNQGSELPTVAIMQYQVVCLTTTTTRGTYSSASVVVSFSCSGVACPGAGK